MAFQQAPVSLSQIATATGEMWPAMANVLKAPWQRSSGKKVATPRQQTPARRDREEQVLVQPPVEKANMPDYMASVPISSLRPSQTQFTSATTTSSILSAIPKGTLRYSSPLTRTFSSFSPAARAFTTTTRFGPFTLRSPSKPNATGPMQRRTILGLSSSANQGSRNQLAYMEQTANNNPTSASAQNAFYQALLRANMPEIIAERHVSGRYASDKNTENIYNRALERIGAQEFGGAMSGRTQGNQMSSEQLQAIGQAVSAKNHGGNVSISKQGSGAKNEPLYVVVDESLASTIFKWVRFFFIFGLVGYCVLVVFTLNRDNLETILLCESQAAISPHHAKPACSLRTSFDFLPIFYKLCKHSNRPLAC